ncbi:MAG TPA: DoxX family protein [Euzebyales bacterium]|nr:DoxX family protein [Euzebyales bacterium]
MIRALARLLLSSVFLQTSLKAIQNAERMTAGPEALGLPEPVRMVQLHGVTNLVGGVLLALGIKPRLAAWALVANLVPTTLAGHRFWEEDDEGARLGQEIQFFKNISMLGGLFAVIAAEGAAARD